MNGDRDGLAEEMKHRLDAIERNVEWLREHDLDEHAGDGLERAKLIEADAQALAREIADEPTPTLGEHLMEKYNLGGRNDEN